MEKIFDIAKDSEKSWGVIAQGIDGNFEKLASKVDDITGIFIFNGEAIWGTTLDKKINVSRYKGKTLKFFASNSSISGTTARLLQTSTDDSSGIIEGKEISVKIGDQYDVEIDSACKKLWLYSSSSQDDVVLAVKVYVNGYEIDTKKSDIGNSG